MIAIWQSRLCHVQTLCTMMLSEDLTANLIMYFAITSTSDWQTVVASAPNHE